MTGDGWNRSPADAREARERAAANDVHHIRTDVEVLKNEIRDLERQVGRLESEIAKLVSRLEFAPVKLITYGMAASILAAVVAALLSQVLKHQ